jgi:hypothetical protein
VCCNQEDHHSASSGVYVTNEWQEYLNDEFSRINAAAETFQWKIGAARYTSRERERSR